MSSFCVKVHHSKGLSENILVSSKVSVINFPQTLTFQEAQPDSHIEHKLIQNPDHVSLWQYSINLLQIKVKGKKNKIFK